MTQQTEIEFKNIVTYDEYHQLCAHFNVSPQQVVTLANHYFDTAALHIKDMRSGLRIRQTNDAFEATLKQLIDAHTSIETNVDITEADAQRIFSGGVFPDAIQRQLLDAHIPVSEINHYGSLTTKRIEVDYKGGLLVLDHALYLGHEDYELEYEAHDATAGALIFAELLAQFNIPTRQTKKKIARFADILAQQKG